MENLLLLLREHQSTAYIILFLGAYLETLVFTSFFIYGEIFFLAGGILAASGYMNIYLVSAVLFLGGILGDQCSYFLGRHYGKRFFFFLGKNRFLKNKFSKENFEKGEIFIKKWGGVSAFVGRLTGPASWITPFLNGIFRSPYFKFLPFDLLGILIGIGQFIIMGYFFGAYYPKILAFGEKSLGVAFILAGVIGLIFGLYKRAKRRNGGKRVRAAIRKTHTGKKLHWGYFFYERKPLPRSTQRLKKRN